MANCENCTVECERIEERVTPESVPYIVYESAQARNERSVKRLIIALVIAVALIFASNAAWLWVWNQYDFASYEVSTDGGGDKEHMLGKLEDMMHEADSEQDRKAIRMCMQKIEKA